MATDIIARGMAANAKKSVTELDNKIESEKWIGTKAEWEAVDKSTIKDGTIVYITDDKTVILYDKAEMEKIAAKVAEDRTAAETAAQTAQAVADSLPDDYVTAVGKIAENTAEINNTNTEVSELKEDLTHITGTEKIEFINNKKVELSYSIGETIELTPVDEPQYRCAVLDCEYGDIFLINCVGGVSPRAYGFVDENNKLIKVAIEGQTLNNELVVVPENAKKIVINDRKSNGVCYKNPINKEVEDISKELEDISKELEEHKFESNERISRVEEASLIIQSFTYTDFIFKHIISDGSLTTNNNRNVCFRSAIFVKRGSTISVDSGYKYQYAMYDKNTGVFISRSSWKTEKTILDTDCKIRVEISDKSESVLTDLSIVEHLHMMLYSALVSEIVGSLIDKDIVFENGKNINLNYDVGTTIDLNPEDVSLYSYAIQEVEPGDIVVVNAKGGSNPRVWGFVDENNVLISVADISTSGENQVDLRLVVPNNATKVIINSTSANLGHCYILGLYKKFEIVEEKTSIHDQSITKLKEDVSSLSGEEQNALRQSNNIIYTIGIDTFKNKVLEIAQPIGYKAWSFIGKVKNKLICLYSVGTSHTDSRSNIFYKVSENGIVWSVDRKIISTDNQRDNVTGKGYDNDGNFVFWVRRGYPGDSNTKFELYKTVDGNTFEIVSSNLFATATGHIGDIVNIEGHGMFAFWNNYGDSRSWGYVKSTDNGVTWTETAVESNLPVQNCPVEMSPVYLGNGKILVMGRQDATSTLGQFQIQSNDYGENFTKQSTNITDISQSTPSVIYSSENDLVSMYYFARSNGKLMLREMLSSEIWNSPTSWGQAIEVAQVSGRGQDCGNVNACQFNEVQIASFYSGDATNTGIYEVIR